MSHSSSSSEHQPPPMKALTRAMMVAAEAPSCISFRNFPCWSAVNITSLSSNFSDLTFPFSSTSNISSTLMNILSLISIGPISPLILKSGPFTSSPYLLCGFGPGNVTRPEMVMQPCEGNPAQAPNSQLQRPFTNLFSGLFRNAFILGRYLGKLTSRALRIPACLPLPRGVHDLGSSNSPLIDANKCTANSSLSGMQLNILQFHEQAIKQLLFFVA